MDLPAVGVGSCVTSLILALCLSHQGCAPEPLWEGEGGMTTDITRLSVQEFPEDGPSLVVVPLDAGDTPAARYLQHATVVDTLPGGRPLVAVVRTAPLSTPDEIRVTGASRDGQTFMITLEIRRYTGALFANCDDDSAGPDGIGEPRAWRL
jgi:hypothetical protein